MTRVAVCVATCGRPEQLGILLDSLARLRFVKHPAEVLVVVVDNDEAGSGRAALDGLDPVFPWALHYSIEPERNIAGARNHAIDRALAEGADYVAFIDDDEVADPEWLDELLDTQARFGADIVGGAVVPRYADGVPDWVRRGRFFEIPRRRTGTRVEMAFTGNVLIDADLLRDGSCRFDPYFGLSGGEDSHFFMRAHQDGARLVWADEAVVEETVPVSRANGRWILRRAFRVGNGYVFCERSLLPWTRWLLPRVAKAALRIVEGLVLVVPSALAGRAAVFRSLRKVAHGLGCLAALGGVRKYGYQVAPRN